MSRSCRIRHCGGRNYEQHHTGSLLESPSESALGRRIPDVEADPRAGLLQPRLYTFPFNLLTFTTLQTIE
jgi:hypothetical protein